MLRYDRAINVFSPDGYLFQVEYALEADRKDNAAVGVSGSDTVVLGVVKKATPKLQDSRSVRKIVSLDKQIAPSPAPGKRRTRASSSTAPVWSDRPTASPSRTPSLSSISPAISPGSSRSTHRAAESGPLASPRSSSASIRTPAFQPSTRPTLRGPSRAWKANATGRNSNPMREFLEKNYKETSGQETVKLAIRALLEVVESGGKNIEIAVMTKEHHGLQQLEEAEIEA